MGSDDIHPLSTRNICSPKKNLEFLSLLFKLIIAVAIFTVISGYTLRGVFDNLNKTSLSLGEILTSKEFWTPSFSIIWLGLGASGVVACFVVSLRACLLSSGVGTDNICIRICCCAGSKKDNPYEKMPHHQGEVHYHFYNNDGIELDDKSLAKLPNTKPPKSKKPFNKHDIISDSFV